MLDFDFTTLAYHLADEAGIISRQYFGQKLDIVSKSNGMIDVIVEDHLGIYDFVALVPVIEGAGGIITDWNGQPKTLHGDSTLIAAGSKNIHSELLVIID